MITITIAESSHVGLNTDVFTSLAKKVLNSTNQEALEGELALAFVSDATIKKLNNDYRGKNSPTDVLSFSYLEDKEETIGELIISTETAARQAKDQGHDLQQEVEILFVHGLLHILGYDHEKKSDLQEMMKIEVKVLGDKSGLITRAHAE